MKNLLLVMFALIFAASEVCGQQTGQQTARQETQPPTQKGVTINGVTWADCNVDEPGEFARNPEDLGEYFTFDEAQTACPEGWRVPAECELEHLATRDSEWTTVNGVNGSRLGSRNHAIFLPAAGAIGPDGKHVYAGFYGYYWSSTGYIDPPIGIRMFFSRHLANFIEFHKDSKLSVRCVQNQKSDVKH